MTTRGAGGTALAEARTPQAEQGIPGAVAAPRRSTRRRIGGLISGALLWVGAIGGVLCVVGVLLAWWFNITLIMFATGSMSPTIPTGSVAVARQIPAAEITVGDVVTVDRPGKLPVTHRVRSVAQGSGDTRTIVLRGDANEQDDPAPYTVSTVRRVIFAVPGVASVIVWFGNPLVLGGVTLSAAVLVLWAFWPRRVDDESTGSLSSDVRPADEQALLVGLDELLQAPGTTPDRDAGPTVAGSTVPAAVWIVPPLRERAGSR